MNSTKRPELGNLVSLLSVVKALIDVVVHVKVVQCSTNSFMVKANDLNSGRETKGWFSIYALMYFYSSDAVHVQIICMPGHNAT